MSEVRRPHEVLLDDAYWIRESEDNLPPMKGVELLLETLYGVNFRHFAAKSVIRSFKQASKSGYDPDPIKTGQRLPILARNDGLIRAVEDTKKDIPLDKLDKIDHEFVDSEEEFDELANEILSNKLYQGNAANLIHIDQEKNRAIKISRTATYLTGSITRHMLVGLNSELISGRSYFETTDYMYPVIVGKVYKDKEDKLPLSKVIQADILEPGKKSRGEVKVRAKTKKVLSPSFG